MWQINRTSLFIVKRIEARNGLQRIQKVNIVGDINTAVPLIPEQARQANLSIQIMYALQQAYNNCTERYYFYANVVLLGPMHAVDGARAEALRRPGPQSPSWGPTWR